MIVRRLRILVTAALLLVVAVATAAAKDEKLPRFESLRADLVNLRAGPGTSYPIEWVYQRRGLPVEVTAAFDVWRRVRDSDGTEGWVHERMLTRRRDAIVTGAVRTLYATPDPKAHPVARLQPGVVARLLECQGAWCRLEIDGIKGWLPRANIWGVFPDEMGME